MDPPRGIGLCGPAFAGTCGLAGIAKSRAVGGIFELAVGAVISSVGHILSFGRAARRRRRRARPVKFDWGRRGRTWGDVG